MSICVAYGQGNPEDTIILLQAFREVTINPQIIYVDTVHGYGTEYIDVFDKKLRDKRHGHSLNLTRSEKKMIVNHLKQKTIWSDSLFQNSKCIGLDSMWSIVKPANYQRLIALNEAKLKKDTEAIKNLEKNYRYVFSFLKPIYIRNNTFCLIVYKALCDVNCGNSEMSIYKKENNKWTKWLVISEGNF